MIKWLVTFLLLINSQAICYSASYYLSNNGDDQNSGKSIESPWKSIEKLNKFLLSEEFHPGDEILFRKGDLFYGQINLPKGGNKQNPVKFGAYGFGEKPIISGAIPIIAWDKSENSVLSTHIDKDSVFQLFLGKAPLTLARSPNHTLFTINKRISPREFRGNEPGIKTGKLRNVSIRIRPNDYSWEHYKVSTFLAGGKIRLNEKAEFSIGSTYYLENNIAFLDQAGEWFFDSNTKYLSLLPPEEPNSILASVYSYGIKGHWNLEYVEIEELDFQFQGKDGIWLRGANSRNNTVINCNFLSQVENGINMMGDSISLISNQIEGCLGRGISAYNLSNSSISKNRISQIGLMPGWGIDGIGGMTGIYLDKGSKVLIEANEIRQTGYNGITCNLQNSEIINNFISNPLLCMDDGAGIYAWGESAHHCTIKDNWIQSPGELKSGTKLFAGIYLDNDTHHINLEENIIYQLKGFGILLNADSYDHLVKKNWVFEASTASINISEWATKEKTRGHEIIENHFFAKDPDAVCLWLKSKYGNEDRLGHFDKNIYYTYKDRQVARKGSYTYFPYYSLDDLRREIPNQNELSQHKGITAEIRIEFLNKFIQPNSTNLGSEKIKD